MTEVDGIGPVQHAHPAGFPSSYQPRQAGHEQEPAPAAAVPISRRDWTINGDFLALRPTGVARYAREVTLALDQLMTERHPLTHGLRLSIVSPVQSSGDFRLRSIPMRIVQEYKRPRLPQFWVQAQLPFHVDGGVLSFCNLAPVFVRRQIVCIHDLHTRLMPQSYGRGFRWVHRLMLPALGRRAAAVTTVSNFSRDHIAAFRVAPFEKIAVTYNGSEHVARWKPERSTIEFGERPYVFCLGQTQKYKNAELLLQLAPALDRMGLDLYIAGDLDADLLERCLPEEHANLRLLGRISDDDLAKALSHALCFLFPSRIEGFGIPAVEAMTLGCPLIASTSPSLPEVCGDAALYANPNDREAWISAIRRIYTDDGLRKHLAEKGIARAKTFSWRRIAEQYLRLMADIDARLGLPTASDSTGS